MKRYLPFLFSIFLFSPAFSQLQYGWTQKASIPASGRHRCAMVTLGNRVYIGCGHFNSIVDVLFKDWWEYDPGTNSWTQKADFGGGLRLGPVGFVINGKAYVGTGRDNFGNQQSDLWEYNPATNTWVQKNPLPGPGRRCAVGFAIGNKGYIGTGSYLSDMWEYNQMNNTWMQKANFPSTGRFAATGFALGNKGYIGTGDSGGGNNDFYEFDPQFNTWTPKANVPGSPRLAACGFAFNGKGYIGTGEDFQSGNNFQDFYEFDANTNMWTQINDFAGVARRYMVGCALSTRAYVATGTSGTNYNDLWEYGNLTDVNEEAANTFSCNIFPNPFTDAATVRLCAPGTEMQFDLYDINGKRALSRIISPGEFRLERGQLTSGTYLYNVISQNKILATGKLIIQ